MVGTDFDFVVIPDGYLSLGQTGTASGTIENTSGTISIPFDASTTSTFRVTTNGITYTGGDSFASVSPVEAYMLGTDCDDASGVTYPGAAFNELLYNGYLQDADGDGFGAESLLPCYYFDGQHIVFWPEFVGNWRRRMSIQV